MFRQIALKLVVTLVLAVPAGALGDQTDQRLVALFETLKSSRDDAVLAETEAVIWDIWYASGNTEADRLMSRAGELVNLGQLAAAEAVYSQVIEILPEFSEGWNRRATVRFYQRDFDGSLEDIEQTLRLEPRHFGAIWGLGMILGSQQDYQRAIHAFERLLEIKPNSEDAPRRIEQLRLEMAKQSV